MGLFKLRKNKKFSYTPRHFDDKGEGNPFEIKHKFDDFRKTSEKIKILSEDYYIKSIKITEYIPKKNYIETIDSNYIELLQKGARGATEISLKNNYENYITKGKFDIENFLKKDYLEFIIKLEKFKNKKDGNFDNEIIRFVSDEILKEKNIFKSNHPCP